MKICLIFAVGTLFAISCTSSSTARQERNDRLKDKADVYRRTLVGNCAKEKNITHILNNTKGPSQNNLRFFGEFGIIVG